MGLPFQDSELALTVSRVLSYSVVAVCSVMKFPQIYTILSAKSATGISLRASWLEISSFLIGFFYGYTNNFNISTYGEAGLLALQAAPLIVLIMQYQRKWNLENIIYIIITAIFVYASLAGVVPQYVFRILLSATIVTGSLGTSVQISNIYQLKSRGDVSVITWGLATYGCLVRVFSSVVEVGDYLIILNYIVALFLCSTVLCMCFYYGKGGKKK